jgi:hypothetical protein
MVKIRTNGRPYFIFMLFVALSIPLPYHQALAALITTDSVLDSSRDLDARHRVAQLIGREDVRAALIAQGVDPAEAQARVSSLTDAEVQQVSALIDALPAGGDGLGLIIGVLLIVLLVLLILKVSGKLK